MTTRFDNLPTAELVELERQSRDDRRTLKELIRKRFEVECGREFGRVYRIKAGRFKGRLMKLLGVTLGGDIPMILVQDPVYPVAYGPLNKGSKGWNSRHVQTRMEHLEETPFD